MPREPALAVLSRLGAATQGVFRGRDAVRLGVSRDRLTHLRATGVIERVLPDTYRLTAVARTSEQMLRAALLWAGESAAATGRSAAEVYGLEGVSAPAPEIVVPPSVRARSRGVVVHHAPFQVQMVRSVRGMRVTGPEFTLLRLGASLDAERFEIACEDARRRRLTSVPGLRAYLDRFGRRGRPGVAAMQHLLAQLDPVHAARSNLEVKTRRLLVAHGVSGFVREFPLEWNGRTYRYDFASGGADHPRDQRTALARRRHRLRTRPREVERPATVRLSHRVRDLGQGHAPTARVAA